MSRVQGSLFDEAAVAGGDHLLAGPLAKPRAVELLWYPDVRGRLGCVQGAKTRSQHRGLRGERERERETMGVSNNAKHANVVYLLLLER